MIIHRVEVKNFRSIKEEYINCDDLTILIGRNGSGKSSFLTALDYFYKVNAHITEEDFFNRNLGQTIEFTVTFRELRDDEKQLFQIYMEGDILTITKRFIYDSITGKIYQKYYAAIKQIPQFAEIRKLGTKTDRKNQWNELIKNPGNLTDLGIQARTGDQVDQFMSVYEKSHPELQTFIEQEHQFFGAANVGGGYLDQFTKFVLIPAVKEASEETSSRKGAIYQLLDMIVMRQIEVRKDIQDFKNKFNEEAKKIYNPKNLTELADLGKSISKTLDQFSPGSQLKLDWDEFNSLEIPLPEAKARLIEDNYEGEINSKGHGLQRALILTLFQYLAITNSIETDLDMDDEYDDALDELPENEEGQNNNHTIISEAKPYFSNNNIANNGPDLILAIEEPELYLHPSRCRYIDELFLKLATNPGSGIGARNQIVCTTHSPYFAHLNRFDQIRLIRKKPLPDCSTPCTSAKQFTLDQMRIKLARICTVDPNTYTVLSVRAHTMSVMNAVVNEGFFANVVVVVEGLSDLGIFWKLQEKLGKDWSKLGIVIVPAGGKNNIDRPVVIFNGFCIPTFFIFDADNHCKGTKGENDTVQRNHRYLNLAGVDKVDFPDTQIHSNWAIFNDTIDKELENALGKQLFEELRLKVSNEFGYEDSSSIIKNIECASRFIELVYDSGYAIPILETVVESITALYTNEYVPIS